jgi:hypothetical protein
MAISTIDATSTGTTGTVMVSGNMPAFSAYQTGTAQVVGAGVWTKIVINTKEFDTNTNFDATTNYRFTPTVAGYYQVSATIQYAGDCTSGASIYKNGSIFKTGNISASGQGRASNVSALIYCNGSSDYLEFYAFCNVTGTVTTGVSSTYFQACLMRAA